MRLVLVTSSRSPSSMRARIAGRSSDTSRPSATSEVSVSRQQPEPGPGDHAQHALAGLVLAVAEEGEVAVEQPAQEGDRLVDLVEGVTAGALACLLDHAADRLGQRGEVGHHPADVVEHRLDGRLRAGEVLGVQRAVDLGVDAPTPGAPPRAAGPTASSVPSRSRSVPMIGCTTRRASRSQPCSVGDHRVHEVREVVRVGLDHRPAGLVAVLLQRRGEGAHRRRAPSARLDQPEDTLELGVDALGILVERVPVQVGVGERRQRLGGAVGGQELSDALVRDGHYGRTLRLRAIVCERRNTPGPCGLARPGAGWRRSRSPSRSRRR